MNFSCSSWLRFGEVFIPKTACTSLDVHNFQHQWLEQQSPFCLIHQEENQENCLWWWLEAAAYKPPVLDIREFPQLFVSGGNSTGFIRAVLYCTDCAKSGCKGAEWEAHLYPGEDKAYFRILFSGAKFRNSFSFSWCQFRDIPADAGDRRWKVLECVVLLHRVSSLQGKSGTLLWQWEFLFPQPLQHWTNLLVA